MLTPSGSLPALPDHSDLPWPASSLPLSPHRKPQHPSARTGQRQAALRSAVLEMCSDRGSIYNSDGNGLHGWGRTRGWLSDSLSVSADYIRTSVLSFQEEERTLLNSLLSAQTSEKADPASGLCVSPHPSGVPAACRQFDLAGSCYWHPPSPGFAARP